MSAVHGRLGLTCVLGCLWAAGNGCAEEAASAWEQGRPAAGERTVRSIAWDTLFRLGGRLQDTLLQMPSRMVADSGGVYVADPATGRLVKVDRSGRLVWSWGRRGRGPEEMLHPRHVALDREGRVWLLDVETARIVGIGQDGKRVGSVPLSDIGAGADVFVPLSDGTFLVLAADPERPLVLVGADGRVRERLEFPDLAFRTLSPLAAQLTGANDARSDAWAVALAMADGFFTFRGLRWTGMRGWYVEPVATSRVRVDQRRSGRIESTITQVVAPHFAAADAAVVGDRVFVLFQGATSEANRIVDMYSHATGEYIESLLLPTPVAAFAYADSVYYGIATDPYPTIVAWTPRPDTAAVTTQLP